MTGRWPTSPAGRAGRLLVVYLVSAALLTVLRWLADTVTHDPTRSWSDAAVLGLIGGLGPVFVVWASAGAPPETATAQRAVTRGRLPDGADPATMRAALIHVKRIYRRATTGVVLILLGVTAIWLVAVRPSDIVDPGVWWLGPALFVALAVLVLLLGRWAIGRAQRLLAELDAGAAPAAGG
ncbi:hypothetical protein [Modestobacter sp. NPDC049651]|uniref:hypothetical protein n=1 Tax=unclassified Modestobacter TaxID=2643866 RepID=UPI0033CA06FB